MANRLDPYHRKRQFDATPEPSGVAARDRTPAKARGRVPSSAETHPLAYVIQEHHARRLHSDFRLELDGALKSWAIPKGPSCDPSIKRLAVHVEDHPLEYGSFEGEIPEGNYGAGTVIVWDCGTWEPLGDVDAAHDAYRAGKLKFRLAGGKLHGNWMLVRGSMRGSGDKEQWLLIKERDDAACSASEFDVLEALPGSVMSGGEGRKTKHSASSRANKPTRAAMKQGAHHATQPGEFRPPAASRKKRGNGTTAAQQPDIVANRTTASLRTLAASPAIESARSAKLPATLAPQLATPVDVPPGGDGWAYEIKFDGYRVLVRIDRPAKCHAKRHAKPAVARISLHTRAGHDWTAKFSRQEKALQRLSVGTAWLDGEAVVLDANGVPSFQLLQNAFDANRPQDIVLYLFDIPYLNGYDLRDVPRFTADALLKSACDMALEGIIGKRTDAVYRSGRPSSWVKLKCRRRQEFVIGGYTGPAGSRNGFGALLLGVYDAKGALRYAGRVGTGFDAAQLRSIKRELDAHTTARTPFAEAPRERSSTPVHWVRPQFVAECNFAEWTDENIVRQASFVSLRRDKPARQIVEEVPRKGAAEEHESIAKERNTPKTRAKKPAAKTSTEKAVKTATRAATTASRKTTDSTTVAGVRISHPSRMIDKATQTSKLDPVRYYASVADRILPHLRERPVALVRAPEGIGGELFFQKHSQKLAIPHVEQHPDLDPGLEPLITIESIEALIGAAQMGTIELHTWDAVTANIEKPDRMVFDLDPDPALGWDRMIEAAQLTRTLLDELGLVSFCKTSGGRGLQVVVPLARHAGWDDVKAFSQAVAHHMVATLPEHFSAKMGTRNRGRKIFVDYPRNGRGSSTVAAYSARARPSLGVSVPLAWNELERTQSGDQWTIANLHERLERLKRDPWAGYAKTRERITAEMRKRLGMAR
ncbi:DNA ligase D (plasmid) [Paraburkholderia acidicola]|uniref:DNA ligase (ATP) n=1 Tax=Paraburkholderia acidicola TaxID=1912599 RepID=A0ABV1LYE7_9BURK